MKNILYGLIILVGFSAFNTNANTIIISSYDVHNASVSGSGDGWTHNYTGIITPTSGNFANYTNGSGTLNDGIIVDPTDNNQFWDIGDTSITLHLDDAYEISSIRLFGADGDSDNNSRPGVITSLDITINAVTSNFTTIGFGG